MQQIDPIKALTCLFEGNERFAAIVLLADGVDGLTASSSFAPRDSSSKLGSPLARASVRHYKLLLLFGQILVAVYDSYRKIPAFIFYCVSHNYQLSIVNYQLTQLGSALISSSSNATRHNPSELGFCSRCFLGSLVRRLTASSSFSLSIAQASLVSLRLLWLGIARTSSALLSPCATLALRSLVRRFSCTSCVKSFIGLSS